MSNTHTNDAVDGSVQGAGPKARIRAAEALKRLPWLTEAQAALGWGIILVLIALLGAVYLSQVSRIAITGRTVQRLQFDLDELKRVNANLEKDIAAAQSLERLSAKANELGFLRSQPDGIEYLVVPGYPVTSEASAQPERSGLSGDGRRLMPPETMREAFWLLLRSQFGSSVRGEASDR